MSGQFLKEYVEHKVAEAEAKPALQAPRNYKVVMLNDDYTPMDFVVLVLKRFFYLSEEVAVQLMLQVHIQGKAKNKC